MAGIVGVTDTLVRNRLFSATFKERAEQLNNERLTAACAVVNTEYGLMLVTVPLVKDGRMLRYCL